MRFAADSPALTVLHFPSLLLLALGGLLLVACDSAGPASEEPAPGPEDSGGSASTLALETETGREAIRLQWTDRNGETYRVYRSETAGFDTSGTLYAEPSDAEFEDESVGPSATYYYRVAAAGNPAAASEEKEGLAPPGQPQSLKGEGEFYRARLTWEEAEGNVDGYVAYRSREPFSEAEEAEERFESDGEAGLTDSTALDGVSYTYRVAAVDEQGYEGALSSRAQVTPSFEGDPLKGKTLFAENCSVCHANTDGWDLAAFEFPDTTIHRRGTDHVTEQEVQDIIRFIESKDTETLPGTQDGASELPPFQPGGEVLPTDKAFAMEVFGEDTWPEDLTEEELLSVDLRELPVPFEMPRWSVEGSDQDWLPNDPLPDRLGGAGEFQSVLSSYRQTQSGEDLVRTVRAFDDALSIGEVFPGEHGNTGRDAFFESFEMYRWVSTLIGTHYLRSGSTELPETVDGEPVERRHFGMTNPWWRVGDIMRRFEAFRDDAPKEAFRIAARWFYLAWTFRQDVPGHEQKYMATALDQGFGLKRVAAFGIARGMAESLPNNGHIYTDLYAVHRNTPKAWQGELTIFLLKHLIDRWKSGDQIESGDGLTHAVDAVEEGINNVLDTNDQLTDQQRDRIESLQGKLLSLME